MRPCTSPSATTSQPSRPRSAAPTSPCSNPASPAATATANSSSAPGVADTLIIDHVGHKGDGVAADGTFVPYTLAGETVETEPAPGHADRHRLARVVAPSAERIVPFCAHFTVCGGCAIQHWRDDGYRAWKRSIVVDT